MHCVFIFHGIVLRKNGEKYEKMPENGAAALASLTRKKGRESLLLASMNQNVATLGSVIMGAPHSPSLVAEGWAAWARRRLQAAGGSQ